jgi:DMSO/TMAO reductase YedYZ molybdopterin-dependent catalytic subunit
MAVLVSAALVQVATGFMNVLNWYPFPWYFLTVHRFLGYVLVETLTAPPTPGISRRGLLAAAGAGSGIVVVTSVGQTVTPLEPLGLLAPRQWTRGPQGVPVNRTAEQAQLFQAATSDAWTLPVQGPRPYELALADLDARAVHEARLPINCVEGWSVGASWRGLSPGARGPGHP